MPCLLLGKSPQLGTPSQPPCTAPLSPVAHVGPSCSSCSGATVKPVIELGFWSPYDSARPPVPARGRAPGLRPSLFVGLSVRAPGARGALVPQLTRPCGIGRGLLTSVLRSQGRRCSQRTLSPVAFGGRPRLLLAELLGSHAVDGPCTPLRGTQGAGKAFPAAPGPWLSGRGPGPTQTR